MLKKSIIKLLKSVEKAGGDNVEIVKPFKQIYIIPNNIQGTIIKLKLDKDLIPRKTIKLEKVTINTLHIGKFTPNKLWFNKLFIPAIIDEPIIENIINDIILNIKKILLFLIKSKLYLYFPKFKKVFIPK